MTSQTGSDTPDYSSLRGVDDLGGDVYARWVRIAILVVLVGYSVVTLSDLLVFRTQDRSFAFSTQGVVLVAAVVSLLLVSSGRVRFGAALTLTAVWIELHASLPGAGFSAPSLIVMPVLICAGGMLAGGRAGYMLACLTSLTVAAAVLAGMLLRGEPIAFSSEGIYLWVITTAAMFGSAALVQLGLESFGRILQGARASEQRMANLQRHAPDGMVATNQAGHIVSANPRAEALLGSAEGALLGRSLAEVLGAVSQDSEEEAWRQVPPAEGSPTRTMRLRGENEAVLLVEARANPVPWADGSVGMQVTFHDITEQERASANERALRAQLEHSQRLEAIGRLAGGVAHEFNNLLTVVGGAAELLFVDAQGAQKELAAEIMAAKVRGAILVKQLLAFARKDLFQPMSLSLGEIVRGVEPLLQRVLSGTVTLALELPSEATPVVGDQGQLEQVLLNLVVNAKDAVGEAGRIVVGVAPPGAVRSFQGRKWTVPGDAVELWVEDTGPGIAADVLDHLFEPFFTTKPRGKGTGLGLSMVHGIVSQNGGTLEVMTEPGRGSVFLVRWPTSSGD